MEALQRPTWHGGAAITLQSMPHADVWLLPPRPDEPLLTAPPPDTPDPDETTAPVLAASSLSQPEPAIAMTVAIQANQDGFMPNSVAPTGLPPSELVVD